MRVEELSLSEWDDALPGDGFEVFHHPSALEVLGDHATSDLRLFGGFRGDHPVGLMPVFVRDGFGTVVLSPPPGMGVPRLGPVVSPASPKRRKREQVNREFTRAVFETLGKSSPTRTLPLPDALDRWRANDPPVTMLRIVCNASYADPRPYVWSDCTVTPRFTYRLPVASRSPDDILASFSRSLRREIRDGEDVRVDVERGGLDAAHSVYRDTLERYREQEMQFDIDWPYVRDLLRALDDEDRYRVYVARDAGGEFLGGITVLYSNDAAYFWQGGNRATCDGVSVNSLLHWRIVRDLADDPPCGVTAYDLMGANTERLCEYKAKFGAELVPYYTIESGGLGLSAAKRAYTFLYK